jgi:lipid II:glycine glycyltransferase (peptidoglycan interpeptide bridge formation enzyme)
MTAAPAMNDDSLVRLTREEWDSLTEKYRDFSYRQCGSYAESAARDIGAICEFMGVHQAGDLVGLANLRIKMVPLLGLGVAYVNYGPLTDHENEFSAELFGYCLDALRREYVERRRLVLRIVPPLRGGQWVKNQSACLQAHGFQFNPHHKPHETFILDLVGPLTEIHKNLDAKWRSDLAKAQKSNIEITRSTTVDDVDKFAVLFYELIRKKGFSARQGITFFRRVLENAGTNKPIVTHLAWYGGDLVAGHIGSFVGDTGVYLLGAANAKGRELRASYLLQWAAIEYAKSVGNVFYDLGGIDQEANPDVYRFKKRLNGRLVAEIGPYEQVPNPSIGRILHFMEAAYNLRSLRRRGPNRAKVDNRT